jgi:hypothetical protein
METSMKIEDFNIPDDIEVPFQCYTCDINDMNNEQPEIITHVLIPKTKDSLLFYPKIPIDIPLEKIKNKSVQRILLTLECEGIRKIQDEKTLKLFCEERLRYTFSDIETCNIIKQNLNNNDMINLENKNVLCYYCLNKLKETENVVYHSLYDDIYVHEKCFNMVMNNNLQE